MIGAFFDGRLMITTINCPFVRSMARE